MATQTVMVIYSGGLIYRIKAEMRPPRRSKPRTAAEKEAAIRAAQKSMEEGYL